MKEEKGLKAELLSPAASFESVRGAINAGADAVYIGGRLFGARAYADNMDEDELLEAIDYVHLHQKKIYLTVNTLLKETEIEHQFYRYLAPFYERGLDAVIVQDLGVLSFIRRQFPHLSIHASTQMTITGAYAPPYFMQMGVKRIVGARELSLDEIATIHQAAPDMEIESFVHGALCMGYSGQCFFSSHLGERSANRGRCAQPCRLPYQLKEKDGRLLSKNKPCLLSPKDMCAVELLPALLRAGVYSLKIEGRMKRPEYMAGVTAMYRKYLDALLLKGEEGYQVEEADKEELMELYNRGGFHSGYYHQHNGAYMMSFERPNHHGVKVGRLCYQKGHFYLEASRQLGSGDVVEIRYPSAKKQNQGGQIVMKEPLKAGQRMNLDALKKPAQPKDMNEAEVFRIRNESLLCDVRRRYLEADQKIKLNARLSVQKGKPISLSLWKEDLKIGAEGEMAQPALKCAVSREQLLKQLNKTGNTPFELEQTQIVLEEDCFVPVRALNELRRAAFAWWQNVFLSKFRRERAEESVSLQPFVFKTAEAPAFTKKEGTGVDSITEQALGTHPHLTILVSTREQAESLMTDKHADGCYLDLNLFSFWNGADAKKELADYHKLIDGLKSAGKRVYLSLPAIIRKADTAHFLEKKEQLFSFVDGILVHNFEQLCFVMELKKKGCFNLEIIGNDTLYAMNHYAKDFFERFGLSRITFPTELNERELKALTDRSCAKWEIIFYGYLPMMFSAQCQAKNVGRCKKKSQEFYLHDRKNQDCLTVTNCDYCYNTIYNSKPLSLFGLEEQVKALHPDAVRLQFRHESAKQMKNVIDEFTFRYMQGLDIPSSVTDFTRGHFRRGVK